MPQSPRPATISPMSLLNLNPVPTLSAEDNFRLLYLGSYGEVVFNKEAFANDIIRVKGPLPARKYVWDGIDYLGGLDEGAEKLVPFDLVRVYFGDPRSVVGKQQRVETRRGEVGDVPPRDHEIRRLAVLYGIYDVDAAHLAEMVPDVAIYTAEGDEVFCPATDPYGEHVYGVIAPSEPNHDLATNIEKMKAQIKMLEDQQNAMERRKDANDGADVSVDAPPHR
jgi:hypothetical protein